MRKFLLTWYGLTDLRASLGLEDSAGPVLGALLAEDYTDVVILGFTHPDKLVIGNSNFQEKNLNINNSDSARQYMEQFTNTETAHNYFTHWIKTKLQNIGKTVEIRLHSVLLSHLNDTEGIYEAATQSLDSISKLQEEKLVTLYLSPGTPVMAFVWAFAALKYPKLKKRLIGSSRPGRPPETIALPNEWLEWHGMQLRTKKQDFERYDVIFHLFGEQKMPSLLGINQFESDCHIFINTEQFPAADMKQFVGDAQLYEIAVDPYDPENVRIKILDLLGALPSNGNIGFNLTGGTKLMYAGALAACRKVNATPFYFDNVGNKTIFLNDFSFIATKAINSVETFINLNGNNLWISKLGNWDEIPNIGSLQRNRLTSELWLNRSILSKLYKELSKYNDASEPFKLNKAGIIIQLTKALQAEIIINNKRFVFDHWPDFARYLSGGWFEEYIYLCMEPLLNAGKIKDLRIGLEVSIDDQKGYQYLLNDDLYHELDITFTDGKSLYIVECKSGGVKSDHIMKLQNIVRYFGGITGKGVLACCFSPKNKVVKTKINESKNINLVTGDNLLEQIELIISNNN